LNRRSIWPGGIHLLTLLCASQLLVPGGPSAAAGTLPSDVFYLGQKPPGEKPERFAPELLSSIPFLGIVAFAPRGGECFITVDDASYSMQKLLTSRYVNGAWTAPEPAPFTTGFEKAAEPFYSADGMRLTFTAQAKDSKTGMDFWTVNRSGRGWGVPVRLPVPINSDANEFHFCQVLDGTTYFLSNRSGSPQVYRARQKRGQAPQVELIPAPVLSVGTYDGDPLVAPDGRFLVFHSGRAGGFGAVDLYVCFPDGKGEWTAPVNLGADFNTEADEYGASLSPDGKYLFFVRHSPQRGDIYWASTRVLEQFRR
jgi:dipeptidyl aminopeptidase/acylaminoacyl peptidase